MDKNMKYIVATLPEENYNPLNGPEAPVIETEEEAIKQATRMSRGRNVSVGIFKIVKKVDPPSPVITDIEG